MGGGNGANFVPLFPARIDGCCRRKNSELSERVWTLRCAGSAMMADGAVKVPADVAEGPADAGGQMVHGGDGAKGDQ